MNGRTCQLCGKPLSRIWAGGGGDFCSREHRNQHRLRCGMDTLLEANKHASLMRRRDQPRQFLTAHLQCNSAIEPRAFGPIRQLVARPLLRHVPEGSSLARARVVTGDGRFLPPAAAGGPWAAQPRLAAKVSAPSSNRVAPLPIRRRSMPAALRQADAAPIRSRFKMASGARRSFVMLAKGSRRAFIPERPFRSLDLEPLGNLSGRHAHKLKLAGKVGNAFRISGNTGFRVPSMRLVKTLMAAPAAQGLPWPDTMVLRRAAHIGRAIVPTLAEQDFPPASLQPPAFPKRAPAAGLQTARAIPLPAPPYHENHLDSRHLDARRPAPEGQPVLRRSGLRAGQSSAKPDCLALKLVPAGAAAGHRLERAPFEPQDGAMIGISYPWNSSR